MGGQKGQRKSTPKSQPSKEMVNCPEPNCNFQNLRYRMTKHFQKFVSYDQHGKPYKPGSKKFNRLSETEQAQTNYFHDKQFDKNTNLKSIFPGVKFSITPKLTPFERINVAKKRKIEDENTAGGSNEINIENVYDDVDDNDMECANEIDSSSDSDNSKVSWMNKNVI